MRNLSLKILIITILFFSNILYATLLPKLTHKEELFLQNHPTIVLGTGDSWAPYAFIDENGIISGYDIDILTKINKATGANFILQLGDWHKMQEMAKARDIDGLSQIGVFTERKQWFNFSNVYISMKKMVIVKKGNPLNIKSFDDLSGKNIVIHKSNMPDNKIAKKIKDAHIIYTSTVEDALKEVIYGKGDALFGNGATKYLSSTLGMPYIESVFPLESKLDLAIAIRNDWPEAINILNKGLATISSFEKNQLVEKWFTSTQNSSATKLNEEQYSYLKNKKEITMCIDPDWMPFEKLDNEKHIGISADYFKVFQKHIGIPIKVIPTENWTQTMEFAKKRKCDIISLMRKTQDRKKYMNFTSPYLIDSVVLATKPNVPFISNFDQLKIKKIGMVKGYAFNEILYKEYPNAKIINVKNAKDGLQKVVDGKLFGFIDTLPTIAYMLQKDFIGELKISAKFEDKWELGIAVRNDDILLLNIFNQLIQNLSLSEKKDILNQYIGIQYEKGFDYSLFWKIFGFAIIVFIILIYRYKVIEKYNKKINQHLELIDNNFLSSSSDIDGNITEISEALCRTTGYKKSELIGKNHNIFKHQDMPIHIYKELWDTILSGKEWNGEIKNKSKDGSYYWADTKITPIFSKNGKIKGFNALRFDITDKMRLKELSITDKLTQISNRLFLDNYYSKQRERAKRYGTIFSIIMIDIDFFKKVNDKYGHKRGDDVLIRIAQILKLNIRNIDIVGRWGGEEFLIICTETTVDKAKIVAEKIRIKIEEENFQTIGHLTCSFGVSQYQKTDMDEDTFKRADEALYKAKESGRNKVCVT